VRKEQLEMRGKEESGPRRRSDFSSLTSISAGKSAGVGGRNWGEEGETADLDDWIHEENVHVGKGSL